MELTPSERLILVNQYKILNVLEPKQDHDILAKHLQDGHKYLYQGILTEKIEDELPEEVVNFILDVCNMFEHLLDSYEALDDKSDITNSDIRFEGFDFEREFKYHSFTRALYEVNKYTNLAFEKNQTAHLPRKDIYMRMLNIWKTIVPLDEYNRTGEKKHLTKSQIQDIIASKRRPNA